MKDSPGKKKKYFISSSLFVSIFFHLCLFSLIGGAVLIQGTLPKAIFSSEPVAEEVNADPEEEPTPAESPEPLSEAAPASTSLETNTSQSDLITTDISSTMIAPALGSLGSKSDLPTLGGSTGTKPSDRSLHSMTSVFGSKGAASDALVGYFYDLKQNADKTPSDMALNSTESTKGFDVVNFRNYPETKKYEEVVKKFIRNWDENVLGHYFRAPQPLSTYQLFFPAMKADEAPKAFDVEKEVKPLRWLILYQGNVTSPVTGEIRFVGFGDDILFVRFNRKSVLESCLDPVETTFNDKDQSNLGLDHPYGCPLKGGSWIRVTAGQSYPMEVLVGESPGGDFRCFLLVQEKGKSYPNRPDPGAGLRLPVFQTAPAKLPSYVAEKEGPTVARENFVFQAVK